MVYVKKSRLAASSPRGPALLRNAGATPPGKLVMSPLLRTTSIMSQFIWCSLIAAAFDSPDGLEFGFNDEWNAENFVPLYSEGFNSHHNA